MPFLELNLNKVGSKERKEREVRFIDLRKEIKERPMKERDEAEVRKEMLWK